MITYLQGHRNPSDPYSRAPMLGPEVYSTAGLDFMVNQLLKNLPEEHKSCAKPWVSCTRNSGDIARLLQRWRKGKNPVNVHSMSAERIATTNYDLAISAPGVFAAPSVIQALTQRDKPYGCLVPSSLYRFLAERGDRSIDLKKAPPGYGLF